MYKPQPQTAVPQNSGQQYQAWTQSAGQPYPSQSTVHEAPGSLPGGQYGLPPPNHPRNSQLGAGQVVYEAPGSHLATQEPQGEKATYNEAPAQNGQPEPGQVVYEAPGNERVQQFDGKTISGQYVSRVAQQAINPNQVVELPLGAQQQLGEGQIQQQPGNEIQRISSPAPAYHPASASSGYGNPQGYISPQSTGFTSSSTPGFISPQSTGYGGGYMGQQPQQIPQPQPLVGGYYSPEKQIVYSNAGGGVGAVAVPIGGVPGQTTQAVNPTMRTMVNCCGSQVSQRQVVIITLAVIVVAALAIGLGAGIGVREKNKQDERRQRYECWFGYYC